jgi:hypothetical protein
MSQDRPAELVQWEHDTFFPKYHLPGGLSLVESYGSIKLMDYESFFFVAKQYGVQPDHSVLPLPTPLRLLATEFLVLPEKQQPEYAEKLERPSAATWPEDVAVWRMKRTLPRAWIVHDVQVLPPLAHPLRTERVDERTKAVLFPDNKARDFRRTAVVETNLRHSPWAKQAPKSLESNGRSTDELCRITHFDPQRIVVEAELAMPGLFVLSEAWFPGWKATVIADSTSREAPIYRTNRVLRGVWLAAGSQRVEFRFEPTSFTRGALVSALSWLALLLGGITILAARRKAKL